MSESGRPAPPHDAHDESQVQEAFDRLAPYVDLDMEEVHASLNRSVGALVVPVVIAPVAEIDLDTDATEHAPGEEAAVRRLLETWEGASPDDLIETWRAHGTRPVVAVGANWIGPIDEKALAEGLASERFQKSLEEFPLYDPRRVTLSEVRLVFLGGAKAIATYRFEEAYTNGKVYVGNAGAILMKESGGAWKVALFTKRTRHLDFFPKG